MSEKWKKRETNGINQPALAMKLVMAVIDGYLLSDKIMHGLLGVGCSSPFNGHFRGKVYDACVRSCMLHASEMWLLKSENELALHQTEMRVSRWTYGVTLRDKLLHDELKQRLEIEDIVKVVQRNRLRWYGHVFKNDDDNYATKCVSLEVEGATQSDRPRRTWKDVVDKDMYDSHVELNDALKCCQWRRMIRGNWRDRSIDSD